MKNLQDCQSDFAKFLKPIPQRHTRLFVSNHEMAEFLKNKKFVKTLKQGSKQAKKKQGRFVTL
jgi:hypothetical protein